MAYCNAGIYKLTCAVCKKSYVRQTGNIRSSRDLIKGLSQHLPGQTEGNDKEHQSGQPVHQPRFELSVFQIRVKSITNIPNTSVTAISDSFEINLKMTGIRTAMGYGLEGHGWNPGRGKIFLFSTAFRLALGPTQPPIQWVAGAIFPGVKQLTYLLTYFILHSVNPYKVKQTCWI
jgi:hypothetical protein